MIISYAPGGYHGHLVSVEVDCRTGIPGMDIVGLPASEVREARDRARVAIRNSGFEFPARRILVSLSPADVPKAGNGFDLAIAASILLSSSQLSWKPGKPVMMIGELHLDGSVGPVRGVLAAVAEAVESGVRAFLVPESNVREANEVSASGCVGLDNLRNLPWALHELVLGPSSRHTQRSEAASVEGLQRSRATGSAHGGPASPEGGSLLSDYAQLRGLSDLKRMLEIAAAGGHHALIVGPPGAGKSAAVGLLPTILPPLNHDEAIEVTRIHSLAMDWQEGRGLLFSRPFRAPHHNASLEGLLGGRLPQIPGEVALAHSGVLFMDEALEFRRPVLQGLREPLERRRIRVARARGNYWFPAAVQLIMATNRCPCGMLGRPDRSCLCSLADVDRYWRRLGGPLLDRIDLRMNVVPRPIDDLPETDSSSAIARRVAAAVDFRLHTRGQLERNADLTAVRGVEVCAMPAEARRVFRDATSRFGFSTRASVAVLRIARTVADLAGVEAVGEEHVLEAVSYRRYGEQRPLWQPDSE
ncbi:MAG: YifB family Mg chelatase-like AAA ATPase [Spirochaetota bacterium]